MKWWPRSGEERLFLPLLRVTSVKREIYLRRVYMLKAFDIRSHSIINPLSLKAKRLSVSM